MSLPLLIKHLVINSDTVHIATQEKWPNKIKNSYHRLVSYKQLNWDHSCDKIIVSSLKPAKSSIHEKLKPPIFSISTFIHSFVSNFVRLKRPLAIHPSYEINNLIRLTKTKNQIYIKHLGNAKQNPFRNPTVNQSPWGFAVVRMVSFCPYAHPNALVSWVSWIQTCIRVGVCLM